MFKTKSAMSVVLLLSLVDCYKDVEMTTARTPTTPWPYKIQYDDDDGSDGSDDAYGFTFLGLFAMAEIEVVSYAKFGTGALIILVGSVAVMTTILVALSSCWCCRCACYATPYQPTQITASPQQLDVIQNHASC